MDIEEILKKITVHEVSLPEGEYYVISRTNLWKLVQLAKSPSDAPSDGQTEPSQQGSEGAHIEPTWTFFCRDCGYSETHNQSELISNKDINPNRPCPKCSGENQNEAKAMAESKGGD